MYLKWFAPQMVGTGGIAHGGSPMRDPSRVSLAVGDSHKKPYGSPPWRIPIRGGVPPWGSPHGRSPMGDHHGGSPMGDPPRGISPCKPLGLVKFMDLGLLPARSPRFGTFASCLRSTSRKCSSGSIWLAPQMVVALTLKTNVFAAGSGARNVKK